MRNLSMFLLKEGPGDRRVYMPYRQGGAWHIFARAFTVKNRKALRLIKG